MIVEKRQANFYISGDVLDDLDEYVATNPEIRKGPLVEKLLREFLDFKKMVMDDSGITDFGSFKRYYDKDRRVEIIFVRERVNGD